MGACSYCSTEIDNDDFVVRDSHIFSHVTCRYLAMWENMSHGACDRAEFTGGACQKCEICKGDAGHAGETYWFVACKHVMHVSCMALLCGSERIVFECPLCPALPTLDEFAQNRMFAVTQRKPRITHLPVPTDPRTVLRKQYSLANNGMTMCNSVARQIAFDLQALRETNTKMFGKLQGIIKCMQDMFIEDIKRIKVDHTNIAVTLLSFFRVTDITPLMLMDEFADSNQTELDIVLATNAGSEEKDEKDEDDDDDEDIEVVGDEKYVTKYRNKYLAPSTEDILTRTFTGVSLDTMLVAGVTRDQLKTIWQINDMLLNKRNSDKYVALL